MTDRDHFAAAALTGLMANPKNNDTTADTIRFWAWNWADAMLRERERVTEPLLKEKQAEVSAAPVSRPPETRASFSATNHGAAPAARAQLPTGDHASGGSGSVGTDNADPLTRWGTGDTQEPVAWGVATSCGVIATSISRIDAVDMQSDYECETEVVPLYRSPTLAATPPSHATHGECSLPPECTQPTLTNEERAAIGMAYSRLTAIPHYEAVSATLRGLLERLG
jgi:hypothetical protein